MPRRIIMLLAFGAFFLASAPAQAVTVSSPSAKHQAYSQNIADSGWLPTPSGVVTVIPTLCWDKRIKDFNCASAGVIQLGDLSPESFFHELGHVIHYMINPSMDGSTSKERLFASILVSQRPSHSSWREAPSPYQEAWADMYAGCSYRGLVASSDMVTPGYKFPIQRSTYNAVCRFFQRVLVGRLYASASTAPTGSIPPNDAHSSRCGERRDYRRYCMRPADRQACRRIEKQANPDRRAQRICRWYGI